MNEYTPEKTLENIFVEINLRWRKRLVSCSYNPNTNLIADHLSCTGRVIDFYFPKYDCFIAPGDLNTDISNSFLEQFCASYNLKTLIKEIKCFKSVDNTTCIDLILTNHPKCFQNSDFYETDISNSYELTFTVLQTYFKKKKPGIIKYRDYKHFDNNEVRDKLIREL